MLNKIQTAMLNYVPDSFTTQTPSNCADVQKWKDFIGLWILTTNWLLLPAYNVRVHVRHLDPIAFFMTKIETTVLSTDDIIEFNRSRV